MSEKKVDVIKTDDGYEALYINNKLIQEGNPLNEGRERVLYFNELCSQYDLSIKSIKFGYCYCEEFPLDLQELSGITYQT